MAAIQAAVLHCFGEMFRRHRLRGRQIRNRSRDLENPVMRTRRQSHLAHRHLERPFAGVVQRAERRHFDVHIDAIQQRSADLAQIALDDRARAAALPRRIGEICARAPVQIATDTI